MTAKFLPRPAFLFLLLCSLSLQALAETNVAGDEITIIGDHPSSNSTDVSINSSLQVDPVLNYLPEDSTQSAGNADASDAAKDDLWQRIKDGYAMPESQSAYTAEHETWYASRPDYVKRMVARSQKYLYHVVEEVEKRGMPTEIALLPMVESAFNPQANSRSRASGIWQFIPSTGKDFGLKQNWWVDNRRDVTAATDAALNYLQKLHVMFGTWDLALAAYNAGEGTVQRAIDRNRRQGLPTDYDSLPLPPETKNYVPKLQAVKNIMTNPEQYGLSIQTIPNRPYFTKVNAPQQIDATLAAKLAEISPEEFTSLNPEYNRPVLTETGNVHEILLPVGAAETFKTNLASYDKPLVSWQTYHAKRGERMDTIARKFGIGLAQLRDVNDLPSRRQMGTSTSLLVPANKGDNVQVSMASDEHLASSDNSSSRDTPAAKTGSIRYTVKKNDDLPAIARKYGVSSKQIMALNNIKNGALKPGQTLLISDNNGTASADNVRNRKQQLASKNKAHYVVKRGDTLDSIARKFDIAKDDLQRWNKINSSHIIPGHILIVTRPDEA
ncbi:MAG TPA: LysM peptidoglycan-binding domain-containing protein [Methylophilaceae bacterium]|jgi:membrane-bound lytic murein transglycosylase D